MIDEIGIQFGSETEKLYLTEIINDRYNGMKPTVIIGNMTVKEVQELLGERIVDRFKEDGQVLIFEGKSFRGNARGE